MTVNTTVRSAGPYAGTGSNTNFSFAFKVFQASDVVVTKTDASGNQRTLTFNVDYSVTTNADQNASPGGSITLLSGALQVGETLSITTNVVATQGLHLPEGGPFLSKAIEDALDKLTIIIQQLGAVGVLQTLRVPDAAGLNALPGATSRAGKLVGFDPSTGQPVLVAPNDQSASALALQLVDAVSAANGAALVGYSDSVPYAPNTIGAALNSIFAGGGGAAEGRGVETPYMHGAAGDGVTDDTTALQAWLDTALANGRAAVLPAGTFLISGNIYAQNGLTAIIGRGGIIKVKAGITINAGLVLKGIAGGAGANVQNLLVHGILIDCNNAGSPTVTTNGIFGQNCGSTRIVNCRVYNVSYGYGIILRNYIAGGASGGGNQIIGNHVFGDNSSDPNTQNWFGIAVDAEEYFTSPYTDTISQWKATFTATTGGYNGTQMQPNNIISGNRVNGGYYGLKLDSLVYSTVSGNLLSNNVRGISLQHSAAGNTISGNLIQDCESAGIHLAYGSSSNQVVGNTVYTTVGQGEGLIQAYVGCQNNDIVGNKIHSLRATGNQYGIYVGVHASGNVIKNNLVRGNVQRAYIAVESAWNTSIASANGGQWTYGYGKAASSASVDGFANATTSGVTVENNTIDNNQSAPSIFWAQVNDSVHGDIQLTRVIAHCNTVMQNQLNQFTYYQHTAGKLSACVLTDNKFFPPQSNQPVANLQAIFPMPNGRTIFDICDNNIGIDKQLWRSQFINSTTPDASIGGQFGFVNTSNVAVTTFTNCINGQRIYVGLDSYTKLVNSTGLRLKGGVDVVGVNWGGTVDGNCFMSFAHWGGVWFEEWRNF